MRRFFAKQNAFVVTYQHLFQTLNEIDVRKKSLHNVIFKDYRTCTRQIASFTYFPYRLHGCFIRTCEHIRLEGAGVYTRRLRVRTGLPQKLHYIHRKWLISISDFPKAAYIISIISIYPLS